MKKVALITGSSRGIGRACAETLARRGYAVCINYIERRDKARNFAMRCLPRDLRPCASGPTLPTEQPCAKWSAR